MARLPPSWRPGGPAEGSHRGPCGGGGRAGYLSGGSSCSWHSVNRRWKRRFCPMTGSSSFSRSHAQTLWAQESG